MLTSMCVNNLAGGNGKLQRSLQDLVWDNASQMLTDMRDGFCSRDDAPLGPQQPLAIQL